MVCRSIFFPVDPFTGRMSSFISIDTNRVKHLLPPLLLHNRYFHIGCSLTNSMLLYENITRRPYDFVGLGKGCLAKYN